MGSLIILYVFARPLLFQHAHVLTKSFDLLWLSLQSSCFVFWKSEDVNCFLVRQKQAVIVKTLISHYFVARVAFIHQIWSLHCLPVTRGASICFWHIIHQLASNEKLQELWQHRQVRNRSVRTNIRVIKSRLLYNRSDERLIKCSGGSGPR